MIHTIIWAIYFILYLIIVSPMRAYYAHQIKKGNREKVQAGVDRMVHNWAHRLLWMAGAKVIVDGKENIPQGTAVFVSNHQSDFDIPVILACVGQPRALMDATRLVKSGVSMTIFPEGTRSKGGPVKEFKGGAFRAATSAKVPVVPVTIDGSFHLLEERYRIHSGTVHVTIHKPIETAGMSRQEVRELPERVREEILSVMDDAYRGA